jgi:uncharacterized protein CbrC (UPF0167 family)
MEFPSFRYHPYPLKTGSIKPSTTQCICCNQYRGFIYSGPTYAPGVVYEECLCPWCIADGSAHSNLQAKFADSAFVGGIFGWPEVSKEIIEEVAFRTPGFFSWQGEFWFTHCNDAAGFLGVVGY